MDLVVDTSVIIAVIANEPEKAALIAQTAGAELLAPASVHWEIGNAFSAMLKRKRITVKQARGAIEAYRLIPLRLVEVDLMQALELASQYEVYAYDAYLMACALNHKCALLTLDRGLVHAARLAGVRVMEITP